MSNKDTQKLINLAKKSRSSHSSRIEVMERLVNAGILDKSGKYSKNYPALALFSKGK
jgi:hypothetical protein